MLTGAGTVHSVAQATQAIAAGARFVVSPGLNPDVVRHCQQAGVPVLPGVSSPTDLETALTLGLDTVKFFPAENLGGLVAIQAIAAAYGEIRFMPTGGINENNLGAYASHAKIFACGGSWMVPEALVQIGDWEGITKLTQRAVRRLHGFRLAHVGINAAHPQEAEQACRLFCTLFGWEHRPGAQSHFSGTAIEVMTTPYLGEKGHIAVYCNQVERARAYMEKSGIACREDTARTRDGVLQSIYLAEEIAGFAIHLIGA